MDVLDLHIFDQEHQILISQQVVEMSGWFVLLSYHFRLSRRIEKIHSEGVCNTINFAMQGPDM
jgi:hypothetical protein